MAGERNLQFNLVTKDEATLAALRRLKREFGEVGESAQQAGKRGKSAGEQFASFAKGLAVAGVAKFAIGEAEEAQQTAARTAAVIKSTGNAAQISAKQQDQYVQALSKTAAVDDEVIAGGANLLRTFTNIKGDAFQPALTAAVDLSAAMGTDLQGSIVQVGKALNDPIKGLAALSRVGVSFTQQQKDQIKAMAQAGDVAGAQKLILGELSKEFGGSAEAMATDSKRAQVAIQEAGESVGKALAPAVKDGAQAVAGLSSAFGALPQSVQTGTVAIGAGAAAASKLYSGFKTSEGVAGTFATAVGGAGAATALTGGALLVGSYALTEWGNKARSVAEHNAEVEEGMKSLTAEIISTGHSAEQIVQSRLPDFIGENADALDEFGISATDLQRGLTGSAQDFQDMIKDAFGGHLSAKEFKLAQKLADLRAEMTGATKAAKATKGATEDLKNADLDGSHAAAQHAESEKQLGLNVLHAVQAYEAFDAAINKLTDDSLSAFNAQRSYESAVRQVTDAENTLKYLRAGKAKAGDIEEAERGLTDAIAGQVEARDRQISAQDKVNGKTTTATARALLLRAELSKLQEQTHNNAADLAILAANLDKAAKRRKVVLDTKEAQTAADRLNVALAKYLISAQAGASTTIGLGSSSGPGSTPPTRDPDAGPRRNAPLVHIEHVHATDVQGAVNAIDRAGRRNARHARAGV